MLSSLDMTTYCLVSCSCGRKAVGFAPQSSLSRSCLSEIPTAARLPLQLQRTRLRTAHRRQCHAAAQQAGTSAEAAALSEAEVSPEGVSAIAGAAADVQSVPALEPADVCEAHTLHVAVRQRYTYTRLIKAECDWSSCRNSLRGCTCICLPSNRFAKEPSWCIVPLLLHGAMRS